MPRRNPEKLAHPSSGNGTLSHLGMEVFKQRAGITILHVPYRGSVPAMTDLMTGIVGVAMDTVAVTEPFIRADKMRLIASAYGKRVAAFPDTPTVAEQGFAEVDLSAWLGIVATAATPKARVDRLGAAINKIVQSPEISAKFTGLGAIPRTEGPAAFGAFLAERGRALERGGQGLGPADRVALLHNFVHQFDPRRNASVALELRAHAGIPDSRGTLIVYGA